MQKIQNTIYWAILASETTHIFCCVLPTIVSIAGLLSGLGLITAMPVGLNAFHDVMHQWEVPMIIFSGIILILGWGLHLISKRLDCLSTGHCHHKPCKPKKKNASKILIVASALFIMNVSIYAAFHKNWDNQGGVNSEHNHPMKEQHHHGHVH